MRKYHVDGHVYYITTAVYNRLCIFTRPSFVTPLYDSLNYYRAKLNIKLLGYVFMPDHIHLLVWPDVASRITDLMRDFKEFTAKRIVRQAEAEHREDWLSSFRSAGDETGRAIYKVWQDDFWEMNIFSEQFMRQKLNYIHRNPVHAGLVETPEAYVWSSYRNYVLNDDAMIEVDRDWQ